MKIFIDSANVVEIEKWLNMSIIDGVTTDPSIMLKDDVFDIEAGAKEIARLVNTLPLSVEVTTNDLDEMLAQAHTFASWEPNIVVKIPQINQDGVPCYGVMNQLEKEGIRVNATVALSLSQAILAAKAGATYISIFTDRVSDEGGDANQVISDTAAWLEYWDYPSEIIVGSIRSVGEILGAAKAGAHIITIPPEFLTKMADHKYTRETVRQFVTDARNAMAMIEKEKVNRII
jgi:transaldolase